MKQEDARSWTLLVLNLQDGVVSERTRACAERLKLVLDAKLFAHTLFSRFINRPQSPHRSILGSLKMSSEQDCALWGPIAHYAQTTFEAHTHTALTPQLREHLSSLRASPVFIAGFDTECAVLKTAADLFEAGIRPVVLADYSASANGVESHQAGVIALRRLIGLANVLVKMDEPGTLQRYVEEQFT